MPDLSHYGGRWVGLAEDKSVVAVAESSAEVRRMASSVRPKGHVSPVWISPHPPHIALPAWPLELLRDLLPAEGIWLAGGAVRDLLMDRAPRDWDFVAARGSLSLARSVADALGGAYYPLDVTRGTGRALVSSPGTGEPVTLDFADLRGPDIESDLAVRDFTVNAMALTLDGRLVDPLGGQRDLAVHRLRMTGDRCFRDDPARLLRAVRLATERGFEIEPATLARVSAHGELITTIAAERVHAELVKIMALPKAPEGLECLRSLGLLAYVVPEAGRLAAAGALDLAKPREWELVLATLAALIDIVSVLSGSALPHERHRSALPRHRWAALVDHFSAFQTRLLTYLSEPLSAELTRCDLLKWAALLSRSCAAILTQAAAPPSRAETAGCAESRMFELRFSRSAIDFVATVVREAGAFGQFSAEVLRTQSDEDSPFVRRAVYRYFRASGDAGIGIVLLALARTIALWRANPGDGTTKWQARWTRQVAATQVLLRSYFDRHSEVIDPGLLITGRDVMALGISRGPAVGRVLEKVREAQAVGEVRSREDALDLVRSCGTV